MPAGATTQVIGVEETIKELRRIDPEFRKEFNRGARAVLSPTVSAIKSQYPQMPLSGMSRTWMPGSYAILPWQVSKAKSSVRAKVSTRKNRNSVIYISQGYPAAVIFETTTPSNRLGANIRSRHQRIMWPTVDKNQGQITAGIALLVAKAERTIQGKVR
jgi:hypothetical protein